LFDLFERKKFAVTGVMRLRRNQFERRAISAV